MWLKFAQHPLWKTECRLPPCRPPMPQALAGLRQVHLRRGGSQVFAGLNLHLAESRIGLIGHNGAGKTKPAAPAVRAGGPAESARCCRRGGTCTCCQRGNCGLSAWA